MASTLIRVVWAAGEHHVVLGYKMRAACGLTLVARGEERVESDVSEYRMRFGGAAVELDEGSRREYLEGDAPVCLDCEAHVAAGVLRSRAD